MTYYGYLRVSSTDQNEDRQRIAMKEAGIKPRHLYLDRKSGKDFDRPEYEKMVRRFREGDVLFIKSIDRLGRNYEEIQKQWKYLTKDIGIDIVVLDMPLLDTRRAKDLLGTFLSDIVLQVLSFVAENERVNIRERQREGIDAAMRRGVRFGRPECPVPANFNQVCKKWESGKITITQGAELCGMPRSTFYKKAKERTGRPETKRKDKKECSAGTGRRKTDG